MKFYMLALLLAAATAQKYSTPIPILKQINKHNQDGSYSYGYEGGDGTYKIETKYPDGEVFGKYGYVDDQGQVRTVEYGASRRGFEPTGNEIAVPPPTIKVNSRYGESRPLGPNEEDDGQYREDPAIYYQDDQYTRSKKKSPQSAYSQPSYQPSYQTNYQPRYQPSYQPSPQPSYQPSYQPPAFRPQTNYYQPRQYNPPPPAFPNYSQFAGHPATNVDLLTGSYTVNYKR